MITVKREISAEETLRQAAIKFIDAHWIELKEECSIITDEYTKDEYMDLLKEGDIAYSIWVLTELTRWGTKHDYLADMEVESPCNSESIWKIGNKYFKYGEEFFELIEVFPKYKKVLVFE